ncbi:MAG: cell surface protein SprA [Cyclobacteriaceae bacterium]|nr:cell surface protein SprA [Cyclobacteriaceae bacterium]
MLKLFKYIYIGAFTAIFLAGKPLFAFQQSNIDTNASDTLIVEEKTDPYKPSFTPRYRFGDPFSNTTNSSPLFLKDPSILQLDVEIDSSLNYTIYEKIGDLNYRPTSSMSFSDFNRYQDRKILKSYWKNRSSGLDGESAVSGRNIIPPIYISPVLDRIFGGTYVELIPRGSVTLDFGGRWQRNFSPGPERANRNGGFNFDQQINMNVTGKVGEKLAVTANFDNNNSFDFENNLKVEYTGFEEDIIKKLEIGNVSLPLNNTLISGAQNLFGIKAQLQFGKLYVTSVLSSQRGKAESLVVGGSGGAQGRQFEMIGSDYDENRHFFLGHFFRDNYEKWLSAIPNIFSGINVTRVEVYVLNRQNNTQTLRNVVSFMDLGEPNKIYNNNVTKVAGYSTNDNNANTLYGQIANIDKNEVNIVENIESLGFSNGIDFAKVTGARKLDESSYTVNRKLGYVSLRQKLTNDEVLAVSYEYTYNGNVYKVGELSEDYATRNDNEVILMKMLRPGKISIRDEFNNKIPTWDLMMKNIYYLGANQVEQSGFQLKVIYRDDITGLDNPSLQEGSDRPIIELLGLDRLNPAGDQQPDGNFDYVQDLTIDTQNGLIIFPYLEPFNTPIANMAKGKANEDFLVKKYVYDTLYRTTRAEARQIGELNKFYINGSMESGSSSEIALPAFNIAQGSVKVFAGGTPLIENSQYTVDYTFSKVRITDQGVLNSGKSITINYETADLFDFQQRTLLGSRFDYKLSDEVNVGGTFLFYNEISPIKRVNAGNEPARNVKYGFDINLQKESRFLTKAIDFLPLIQTKEPSTITFNAEFAQLIPGTSNKVDGENASYVDDFENSATPSSLNNPTSWNLASTPQTNDKRFTDNGTNDELQKGYKRAKLAWYQVDNIFYREGGRNNPEVPRELLDNHYSRGVLEQEIFPFRSRSVGINNQSLLNIAYFPEERGPYNYSTNLTPQGLLKNPIQNWGGITRAIRTEVDFDNANIEYIEFWLMDPFINVSNNTLGNASGMIDDGINDPRENTTGGELYFNLGSINEDLIPDRRHGFENGLPADGSGSSTINTAWGRVTTQQYLTNAFDNSGGRENQDVGMDGLRDDEEDSYFNYTNSLIGVNPSAIEQIKLDPSADNFRHYLEYSKEINVVERYKNFNGHDGNTPIPANEAFVASGSTIPENEDLNSDNTLNELEEYYEYKMSVRPTDMVVGKNNIVDQIIANNPTENGQDVKWYLVRIPIRKTDGRKKYGNISNFKSIKYIRTYLTGFDRPIVLRMANFRMVGSQWRKMTASLLGNGAGESVDSDPNNLTVSVVNIEENAQGNNIKPSYTLPPGVVRDRDNTSAIFRELNEQSLQLCVEDLADNDARAVFKNLNLDLINYGRLKMFISAHSQEAQDDELSAFIRLGSDQNNNYYEIEVPLKMTAPGTTDPRLVWPLANEIDIDFEELFKIKKERVEVLGSASALYPAIEGKKVGHHSIRIKGNPVLSQIQFVVIGIRNPKSTDQRPFTGCIWVNELRVTDFDKTSGWAANASLNTKLADIGNLTASTRYTSFGFGNVQSKIGERTREETLNYDVGASISLDKFFPEKMGLQLPMFVSFEKTNIKPKFDPEKGDLSVEERLVEFETQQERDDYRIKVQDNTVRRSLNFSNVKKVKTNPNAKKHIYDIENFAFTYAYSEVERQNFNIAEYARRNYRGAIDYIYAPDYDGWAPFEKSKAFKSPYLKLIKDFNVNPLPDNLSVRANIERQFEKTVYQNQNGEQPNYQKYFYFDRNYSLKWSLANSLSLDYTSRAHSVVDEPDGDIDTQEKYDEVVNNVKNLGRLKTFDQDVALNYRLPLDKFPFTDWVNSDYRYSAGYSWAAGSLINSSEEDSIDLFFGHVIQNSRVQGLTGKFDLVKLYNKVELLKKINSPPRRAPSRNSAPDTTKTLADIPLAKGLLRLLMSVRSINATYNITEGTLLPGFDKDHFLLGMDSSFISPGWDFILGDQNPAIRERAADNDWLIQNRLLTTPYSQTRSEDLNIKATVEPIKSLKIQLNASKRKSTMYQEIFRYDSVDFDNNSDPIFDYVSLSPNSSGSYSISFFTLMTAFEKDKKNNNSAVFQEFEQNRIAILNRLKQHNPKYDTNSQDVLIPAFIAAYSGKSADLVKLSPFPRIPLPNWRFDYSGLGKIEALKELFSSVSITHSYKSSYSVSNFTSSAQYKDQSKINLTNNVENYNVTNFANLEGDNGVTPVYVIGQVIISEQFSPLIGLNIRTKKRATIRAEYKKQRDLSLNLSNNQVTEQKTGDISLEYGFTKTDMKLPFKSRGRPVVLKNDLQFRLSASIKDTKTVQRKIEDENITTNGQVNFRLRPSVNYALNKKLNIEVYLERTTNDPKISTQYKRNTTQAGFKLRFSLAQ